MRKAALLSIFTAGLSGLFIASVNPPVRAAGDLGGYVELGETISELGILITIAAFAIMITFYYIRNLSPRLDRIEDRIAAQALRETTLEEIARNSKKAMQEVSKSNDNVAGSIRLLSETMQGNDRLMQKLIESQSNMQRDIYNRLLLHDDRSEKILTIVKELEIRQERQEHFFKEFTTHVKEHQKEREKHE